MRIFTGIFLLSFLFLRLPVSGQLSADSLIKRTYTATRTENTPKIDGVLDDLCWSEGLWQGDFIQQLPNEGAEPSMPTEIKILYNTNYLFVAMRCHDSEPEKIRSIFTSRDIFGGDMIGIALDSYEDKKTAFEFNVSVAGQKIDLKHIGDYEFDMEWNGVWDVKTGKVDSGWVAEMQIPFSQLRYANKEEHKWGMHIWRWLDRKNEESQWTLIPINSPAMVYLFGELNGIENIRTSRQIELLPYGVAGYAPKTGDNRNPYGKTREFLYNGGFDAKIGLSSDFTLDATINPDFGQVEADPSVLNLTAYETFYEEKRPFFLEGREIFDYEIDDNLLYHSRRIRQAPGYVPDIDGDHYLDSPGNSTILGAGKITGKTPGGLSVGIMESVISSEYSELYRPDQESVDTMIAPYSNFMVARIMKEKDKGKTIFGGIFSTSHRLGMDSRIESVAHKEAYTGGLDFEQNFVDKTYFIAGKMIFSHLKGNEEAIAGLQRSGLHQFHRPGASHLESRYDITKSTLSGTGGTLSGGKKGGKWRYNAEVSWLSPGLDLNDIGYLRQTDVISQSAELQYRETEPRKFSRAYEIALGQYCAYSFGGELIASELGFHAENQFNNLWGISFDYNASFPSFETRELRGGPALWINGGHEFALHGNSNYSKDFSFAGGVHYLKAFRESSENFIAHAELNWHPIDRIRLSPFVWYSQNLNNYQYVDAITYLDTLHYLMGELDQTTLMFTFRAELFITPEMSLQFYGSPYYSVGHYRKFYLVEEAGSRSNSERYIDLNGISDQLTPENTYALLDPFSDPLISSPIQFDNPDFMFGEFRTNLIFRWEYMPGSVLYLVWTHDKTSYENVYRPTLSEDFTNLKTSTGVNVFMIKLNYWFSL